MKFVCREILEGMTATEEDARILLEPRTGDEVQKAVNGDVPVYLYSDLCKRMKGTSSFDVLEGMMNQSLKNIILIQDPNKMNSGHWTSLSFYPRRKEAYFFSSYGGMPDREKMQWISDDDLQRSGQSPNIFNDGLKDFVTKKGWTIHYNQYPYQKVGDSTATCGIWMAAFLNSDLNPDDFNTFTRTFDLDAPEYYKIFFKDDE